MVLAEAHIKGIETALRLYDVPRSGSAKVIDIAGETRVDVLLAIANRVNIALEQANRAGEVTMRLRIIVRKPLGDFLKTAGIDIASLVNEAEAGKEEAAAAEQQFDDLGKTPVGIDIRDIFRTPPPASDVTPTVIVNEPRTLPDNLK